MSTASPRAQAQAAAFVSYATINRILASLSEGLIEAGKITKAFFADEDCPSLLAPFAIVTQELIRLGQTIEQDIREKTITRPEDIPLYLSNLLERNAVPPTHWHGAVLAKDETVRSALCASRIPMLEIGMEILRQQGEDTALAGRVLEVLLNDFGEGKRLPARTLAEIQYYITGEHSASLADMPAQSNDALISGLLAAHYEITAYLAREGGPFLAPVFPFNAVLPALAWIISTLEKLPPETLEAEAQADTFAYLLDPDSPEMLEINAKLMRIQAESEPDAADEPRYAIAPCLGPVLETALALILRKEKITGSEHPGRAALEAVIGGEYGRGLTQGGYIDQDVAEAILRSAQYGQTVYPKPRPEKWLAGNAR